MEVVVFTPAPQLSGKLVHLDAKLEREIDWLVEADHELLADRARRARNEKQLRANAYRAYLGREWAKLRDCCGEGQFYHQYHAQRCVPEWRVLDCDDPCPTPPRKRKPRKRKPTRKY